jgi:hypothetical protein
MIIPSVLKIRIDLSRVPVPVILCESGESRNTGSKKTGPPSLTLPAPKGNLHMALFRILKVV